MILCMASSYLSKLQSAAEPISRPITAAEILLGAPESAGTVPTMSHLIWAAPVLALRYPLKMYCSRIQFVGDSAFVLVETKLTFPS